MMSKPIAQHMSLRFDEDRVFAPHTADQRALARIVLRHGSRRGLLSFGAADTHLHVVSRGDRSNAAELDRRLKIHIKKALHKDASFARTRFRDVLNEWHLLKAFRYAIVQDERHDCAADPLLEAAVLPDLLGLRLIDCFRTGDPAPRSLPTSPPSCPGELAAALEPAEDPTPRSTGPGARLVRARAGRGRGGGPARAGPAHQRRSCCHRRRDPAGRSDAETRPHLRSAGLLEQDLLAAARGAGEPGAAGRRPTAAAASDRRRAGTGRPAVGGASLGPGAGPPVRSHQTSWWVVGAAVLDHLYLTIAPPPVVGTLQPGRGNTPRRRATAEMSERRSMHRRAIHTLPALPALSALPTLPALPALLALLAAAPAAARTGQASPTVAVFSPDARLVAAQNDRTIHVWDRATGKLRATVDSDRMFRGAVVSDALITVITGGVVVRRGAGYAQQVRLPVPKVLSWGRAILSADGRTAAALYPRNGGVGDPDTVGCWDARTGARRAAVTLPRGRALGAVLSADGTLLAIFGDAPGLGALLEVHRLAAKRASVRLLSWASARHRTTYSAAWSPDGKRLALGAGEELLLWDLGGKRAALAASAPTAAIKAIFPPQLRGPAVRMPGAHQLAFSPDGKQLASLHGLGVVGIARWSVEAAGLTAAAWIKRPRDGGTMRQVIFDDKGALLLVTSTYAPQVWIHAPRGDRFVTVKVLTP